LPANERFAHDVSSKTFDLSSGLPPIYVPYSVIVCIPSEKRIVFTMMCFLVLSGPIPYLTRSLEYRHFRMPRTRYCLRIVVGIPWRERLGRETSFRHIVSRTVQTYWQAEYRICLKTIQSPTNSITKI